MIIGYTDDGKVFTMIESVMKETGQPVQATEIMSPQAAAELSHKLEEAADKAKAKESPIILIGGNGA